MEKVINIIVMVLCSSCMFAIFGSFFDAVTAQEAAVIMGSCLVALAVLRKLPTLKSNQEI